MRLSFPIKKMRRLVDHALNAKRHRGYFEKNPGPQLWLVKDSGVYLMSNGMPIPKDKSHVLYDRAYPEGTHVGGDDFAEVIDINTAKKVVSHLDKGARFLDIILTGTKMTLEVKF